MNKELKPLICTQCGGQIDRNRMVCPYCGTHYKKENDQLIRIETFANPVRTYQARIAVPEFYFLRDEQEAQNFVIRGLSHQIADAIAENMEMEIESDSEKSLLDMSRTVRARVRIVPPWHRF